MITHHTTVIRIADIAGVLIHQVLHLIPAVEHQHQRNDGELAAGTRRQVPLTAAGVGLDCLNKLSDIATLDSFPCSGIHFIGILIRRIVRKVAADDEEILIREIRLEHLSHPRQFLEVVRRNDDRHDGRHVAKSSLQER